jgi:hypothetical protein
MDGRTTHNTRSRKEGRKEGGKRKRNYKQAALTVVTFRIIGISRILFMRHSAIFPTHTCRNNFLSVLSSTPSHAVPRHRVKDTLYHTNRRSNWDSNLVPLNQQHSTSSYRLSHPQLLLFGGLTQKLLRILKVSIICYKCVQDCHGSGPGLRDLDPYLY